MNGPVFASLLAVSPCARSSAAAMDSLVQSIRTAKLDTVIELLGKVDDANALSSEGDSALVTCAMVGRLDVLTRLLAAGASPDKPCTSGMSALAAAALSGHLPIVRKLVEAGAQVDLQCGLSNSTALTHAASAGHRAVCEALLEAGADPHLQDAYGRSAIAHAEARDVEGTRQYADWSRWAKQIESRAAAIEAEPAPLRPPFAHNLKEGLAECHAQRLGSRPKYGLPRRHSNRLPDRLCLLLCLRTCRK